MNGGRSLLRFRLRIALLLPVLAAFALVIGNGIWASWIAPDLRRQARRAAYSHALSLGTLAPSIRAERDRLLSCIGPALRADLLALAERYPQLKKPTHGLLSKNPAEVDPPGQTSIYEHFYNRDEGGMGGEPPGTVLPGEKFLVSVILYEHSITEPPMEQQMVHFLIYPHLHLGGDREASADSRGLHRELKSLLDRRLAPLDELEARVARTPIPAQRSPGAAAPTRRPVAPS